MGGLIGLLLFLILVLFGVGGTVLVYATAARDLPSPNQLVQRSSQFETTRIYDRNGQLLQAPLAPDDPSAGVRRRVGLAETSPYLIDATVSTEDANFYSHPGVDPLGLARAIYQAVRNRDAIRGTSTISQQLVKLVFLTSERSINRKVKEAILAAEITRRYPKDTILELYLNEIYYGNLAYGAEAAARIYFDKPASDLTLAEAALLAGLPQSPATYDPFQNPDAAKARQADVLRLMVQHGKITPAQADAAWLEELTYSGQALEGLQLREAPHFVMFVRSEVEQFYGPEMLYRGGLEIYTTLDLALQTQAEVAVHDGVARLSDRQVSNGALVALDPQTGEILAMVGSADFEDAEIDGQVNVTLAPRQPGSAIKPFTYLATFEQAEDYWTPATLVEDVRTEFFDGVGRPPYVPRNYDGRERGWVSVRSALAMSLNIPAVKALDQVGVDGLLDVTQRFGMDTLTRPDHPPYGLALTLGGGETTLLELTDAYGALANGGQRLPPAAILCIVDNGEVVERLDVSDLPAACRDAPLAVDGFARAPQASQAASAQHAYLLSDILKDNAARSPIFGANSALRLPDGRPAAVKTGTTNDVRDGWTVGYTPGLVTGVWVGNSSGEPMDQRLSGSQVAAPIWNQFMSQALAGRPLQDFSPPAGVEFREICTLTGAVPDEACPLDQRRTEVFAAGQLPPGADASRYRVLIAEPYDGAPVEGVVRIVGSVAIPDFDHYLVEYGESHSPGAWGRVAGPLAGPVDAGELALWDTTRLSKDGPHVLRVVAVDRRGVRYESAPVRVAVRWPVPIATASWTPSPTPTATAAGTATPTATLVSTATATPSPLPTRETPTATASPTAETSTPEPSATPTLPAATATSPPAVVGLLTFPLDGMTVRGVVAIEGQATGPGFLRYRVDYLTELGWQPVAPDTPQYNEPVIGTLAMWDTALLPNGSYELRLVVESVNGQQVEDRISVLLAN